MRAASFEVRMVCDSEDENRIACLLTRQVVAWKRIWITISWIAKLLHNVSCFNRKDQSRILAIKNKIWYSQHAAHQPRLGRAGRWTYKKGGYWEFGGGGQKEDRKNAGEFGPWMKLWVNSLELRTPMPQSPLRRENYTEHRGELVPICKMKVDRSWVKIL